MTTFLLRLWILCTFVVVGYPVYYILKQVIGFFYSTSKHLQNQIDQAKSNIRLHPESDDLHIEQVETLGTVLYDDLTENSSPEILSSQDTSIDEDASQTAYSGGADLISETNESEDILDNFFTEQEKTNIVSGQSAEALAQTVEDIKYAALTYKERGKKDDYEKKLIEGIALIGDHEEFLIMLADHYFEAGQYVKAATLLKKIIHINPENHRAIWQLGQIYAHENDKETAKLLLEKARDLKDDNPKYLISLVEIYYEEGNIKECILLVEKLSKIRPTNIDYLLTLGNLHEELNQPTKAHGYYMKVLEINPLNDEAKQALKRLL